MMIRYSNSNRESGVYAYRIGADHIDVQFSTGKGYGYTYSSAGAHHIEQMKILAKQGAGLNGYINSNVKYKYAYTF